MATHQTVLILDFGSQFTQLIARRLREQRVYCEVHPFSMPAEEIRRRAPIGVILSGGPQSVYDAGAPHAERALLELGIPVLGICYGMQLVAHLLDGKVEHAERREYGRAAVEVTEKGLLFAGLESEETVWMSHGDHVTRLPGGFTQTARTSNAAVVGMEDRGRRIYGIQFHPEVSHTVHGAAVLHNFLFKACGAVGDWTMASYLDEAATTIRERTRGEKVLCGISGGVDSAVTAALLKRAIGDDLVSVFVDTGLLRKGERSQVEASLTDGLGIPIVTADAGADFLGGARGRDRPRGQAQGDRPDLHRRLPARGAQVRRREVPRPGDALPGRHRVDLGARSRRR